MKSLILTLSLALACVALAPAASAQGTLSIDVDPVGTQIPVVLPSSGGSFEIDLTTTNTSDSALDFECWCEILSPQCPGVSTRIPPDVARFSLAAGETQTNRFQITVPAAGNFPSGLNFFGISCGDFGTLDALDKDGIPVIIEEPPGRVPGADSGADVTFEPISAASTAYAEAPVAVAARGSHPNPFSASTTISYDLAEAQRVVLEVFDVLGRRVATLVDGVQEAGSHEAIFAGATLPSGTYVYRLTVGEETLAGRMVLAK
ncbi:MAG: T9SS type A sorting domain-containing protein [Rubricoccaceae bacterium]|nr:T9SS type A sorting domain-containing protein [Rubricoccaceae bacterium]